MTYLVYYLLDATSGQLLYVGRSDHPKRRKAAFERKHGIAVNFGVPQRHAELEEACRAERRAILQHKPPYNKIVSSAPGRIGIANTPERRQQISRMNAGRPLTEEVKQKISAALMGRAPTKGNTGKPLSESAKEKLRNRVVSAESRLRMSIAAKNRRKK